MGFVMHGLALVYIAVDDRIGSKQPEKESDIHYLGKSSWDM